MSRIAMTAVSSSVAPARSAVRSEHAGQVRRRARAPPRALRRGASRGRAGGPPPAPAARPHARRPRTPRAAVPLGRACSARRSARSRCPSARSGACSVTASRAASRSAATARRAMRDASGWFWRARAPRPGGRPATRPGSRRRGPEVARRGEVQVAPLAAPEGVIRDLAHEVLHEADLALAGRPEVVVDGQELPAHEPGELAKVAGVVSRHRHQRPGRKRRPRTPAASRRADAPGRGARRSARRSGRGGSRAPRNARPAPSVGGRRAASSPPEDADDLDRVERTPPACSRIADERLGQAGRRARRSSPIEASGSRSR